MACFYLFCSVQVFKKNRQDAKMLNRSLALEATLRNWQQIDMWCGYMLQDWRGFCVKWMQRKTPLYNNTGCVFFIIHTEMSYIPECSSSRAGMWLESVLHLFCFFINDEFVLNITLVGFSTPKHRNMFTQIYKSHVPAYFLFINHNHF